ncbi:DNA (cytosine-5-)-methyltransferase [Aeromicrobium sp. UC242_57]|uniref:DNA (cytosine-5-)-methyltransferase n=1 Tax=Aeromicrobium sp. UC242_57 TaxID=3374624 RepID=UPI003790F1C1
MVSTQRSKLLGGECVYASEIDDDAAKIYQHNWGLKPDGDIVRATESQVLVPEHDVLVGGFPCQPFSKSGFQRGMSETRGTLFFSILKILEARRPQLVLLENVRNLAGPRHKHEWDVIIRELRALGYRVSSTAAVFSPHLLQPEQAGRPQVRERVFIAATFVGGPGADEDPVITNKPVDGWDPQRWDLESVRLADDAIDGGAGQYGLSAREARWIEVWSDFVVRLKADGLKRLPGFPIWADEFVPSDQLVIDDSMPAWKQDFLRKNSDLYTRHEAAIDAWLQAHPDLDDFPASRRKFEWQGQDADKLADCILQFRPSGIRAKRPTYAPALVAMAQTPIWHGDRRKMAPAEAATLQGFPSNFSFVGQDDKHTYKQLGNAVNVGVIFHVLRQQMARSGERWRHVADAAPATPDEYFKDWWPGRE